MFIITLKIWKKKCFKLRKIFEIFSGNNDSSSTYYENCQNYKKMKKKKQISFMKNHFCEVHIRWDQVIDMC